MTERTIYPPFHDQQFHSFAEWVSTAHIALTSHPAYKNTEHGSEGWRGNHFTAMCFDLRGRRCTQGSHFMRARDEDAFPVWWVWPDQVPELLA